MNYEQGWLLRRIQSASEEYNSWPDSIKQSLKLNSQYHYIVEEYKKTLNRAKLNNVDYIWSGDLRNTYLRDCLNWAITNNVLECEFVENYEQQESGYNIKWLI